MLQLQRRWGQWILERESETYIINQIKVTMARKREMRENVKGNKF